MTRVALDAELRLEKDRPAVKAWEATYDAPVSLDNH